MIDWSKVIDASEALGKALYAETTRVLDESDLNEAEKIAVTMMVATVEQSILRSSASELGPQYGLLLDEVERRLRLTYTSPSSHPGSGSLQ